MYKRISDLDNSSDLDKEKQYYQSIQFLPLFNSLNINKVEKSINLFFRLNVDHKIQFFFPPVLALYEITLFLETGKIIDSNKLQKIFNDLRQQNNRKILHNVQWNYYYILKMQTKLLITHSSYYQQKIDDILKTFYQDLEIQFDMRGPRIFSKILLGYRIQQELVDLSYS